MANSWVKNPVQRQLAVALEYLEMIIEFGG